MKSQFASFAKAKVKAEQEAAAKQKAAVQDEVKFNEQKNDYVKDVENALDEIHNTSNKSSSLGHWLYMYMAEWRSGSGDESKLADRRNKVNSMLAEFLADRGYTTDEINFIRQYIELKERENPDASHKNVVPKIDAQTAAQFAQDAANIAAQKQKQSCFTAGSPVATPKGERPISELAVGDEVITLDCNGREITGTVTEVMTPREEEIVEVTFSNGTVWHTTESQTIWLGHEQNYEIKDDAVGRPALVRGGETIAITSVKYTGKYETVYDVLIGEEEDEDVIFVAGIAAEGYFTRGERGLS